jgi:hypothetical protein
MTDPRLARLRAAVEKLHPDNMARWDRCGAMRVASRETCTLPSDHAGEHCFISEAPPSERDFLLGWHVCHAAMFALLDAEAGEPEPYDPPEDWRETPNRDGSLAPPPSDARERLALALNHLAFPCSAGTPQEAADAILAAHREELEPLAENLNATAINAKEALDQVAALTARMADLEREMRDLWQPAAPSGDVAQDHGDTEAARHVVEIPSSPEGAASVQPSPASAWPSEAATVAAIRGYFGEYTVPYDLQPYSDNHKAMVDGLRAAYAVDLPAIERAAEERGARAFAKWYGMDDVDDSVGAVDRWLAQRAEGSP